MTNKLLTRRIILKNETLSFFFEIANSKETKRWALNKKITRHMSCWKKIEEQQERQWKAKKRREREISQQITWSFDI